MNFRILAKILGLLLVLLSMSMVACGIFAHFDEVPHTDDGVVALFTSAGVTMLAGGVLVFSGLGKVERIPRREGVVIVGLGWVLAGVFGALPFLLCPPYMTWGQAIFESISGFTTTGSTVINDLSQWPRGLLLWRSVSQWLGGIGILVLFVAVLSYLGVGSKSLFRHESSFASGDASTARIRDTAWTLLRIYLVFSIVCMVGLKACGMTWFNAINHGMTAVATGGFSPHNESVGYYLDWDNGWIIEMWLSIFMLLSSLNFIIYAMIIRKKWDRLKDYNDMRWFLGIVIGAAFVISFGIMLNKDDPMTYPDALRESWFNVISIGSSTGFGSVDYDHWPAWCRALLAILMVIGGCSGSTTGGMKINRLVVFLKSSAHEVIRAFRPNQVFRLVVNGSPIDETARARTMSFVALYLMIIAVASVMVGMLEAGQGIALETCLAAVLATISNIGPGFGEVGPTDNFSELRESTMLFLGGLMILGRLELFAILVLFVPAAWRRY